MIEIYKKVEITDPQVWWDSGVIWWEPRADLAQEPEVVGACSRVWNARRTLPMHCSNFQTENVFLSMNETALLLRSVMDRCHGWALVHLMGSRYYSPKEVN